MFCREQVARFNDRLEEIEDLGARVVAIGSGTVHMARDFLEKFDIRFDVFTDPSRRSYQAAGLNHGTRARISVLTSAARALAKGHIQGLTKGDPLQQGGVLVVGADHTILFSHADDTAGDHADIDDVITALRSARLP